LALGETFRIHIYYYPRIFLGRKDLDPNTGSAVMSGSQKLTHFSFFTNVVTVSNDIPHSAKIMMITTILYFIIQIPAFFYHGDNDGGADHESIFALLGLIFCLIGFALYCRLQLSGAIESQQQQHQYF